MIQSWKKIRLSQGTSFQPSPEVPECYCECTSNHLHTKRTNKLDNLTFGWAEICESGMAGMPFGHSKLLSVWETLQPPTRSQTKSFFRVGVCRPKHITRPFFAQWQSFILGEKTCYFYHDSCWCRDFKTPNHFIKLCWHRCFHHEFCIPIPRHGPFLKVRPGITCRSSYLGCSRQPSY